MSKFSYTRVPFIAGLFAAALVAPAAVQAEPLAGPYIAVIGGWDRLQAHHGHDTGFVYGGEAGYDFALGSVRLGPVGEISGSSQKVCTGAGDTLSCTRAGRDLFVGARAGAIVAPQTLLYVKGGYANGQFRDTIGEHPDRLTYKNDHSGFRIGAGVELAVSDGFFVKSEYRYSNYSNDIGRNQIIGGVGYRF